MKLLVINGPNLNLLGERNPEQYGSETLQDINDDILRRTGDRHEIRFFQSNHEGDIIDFLHDQRGWADGIVINPGAFTHYSYALRDAVEAVELPCVEAHLSDIANREEFRKVSVIRPVCIGQVKGKGKGSYFEAIEMLENYLQE